jgi:hypothetical protein
MRRACTFLGIALTTGGAVWLVQRLDDVGAAATSLARAAPALLLVIGATHLLGAVWHSRLLAPIVLIAAGVVGLVLLHGDPSDLGGPPAFWPIAAVLAGLAIAFAERNHRESDEPRIDQAAVLRTRKVHRTERPFTVAKVRVLLGSLELDLTRCTGLAHDVEVNVTVLLGYTRIIVPARYQVTVSATEALGVDVPTLPPADGSVVVVKVSVLGFGGAVDLRRAWTQPRLPAAPEASASSNQAVEPATAPISA